MSRFAIRVWLLLAAVVSAVGAGLGLRSLGWNDRSALIVGVLAVLGLPLVWVLAVRRRGTRFGPRLRRAFLIDSSLGALLVLGLFAAGVLQLEQPRSLLSGALRGPEGAVVEVVPENRAPVYGYQFETEDGARVVDSLDQVPTALRGRATRVRISRPAPTEAPSIGSGSGVTSDQQAILDELNRYRAAAGLASVRIDPALSRGCQLHADYLARNFGHPSVEGERQHEEDPNLPGYTAEGASAAADSNIAHSNHASAVALWMATLYHRHGLLDPRLARVGVGLAEVPRGSPQLPPNLPPDFHLYATVMNVAARELPASEAVIFPTDGSRDVPLRFADQEAPNPIAHDPDGKAGYPVSVTFFDTRGDGGPKVQLDIAELADEAGRIIPVYLNAPGRLLVEGHGERTIGLIPADPLRPRERYRVRVEARVDGRPWSRAWSFVTQ